MAGELGPGHLRVVELIPAFSWTCDDCGRDNFERSIAVAPESLDPQALPVAADEDAETIRDWLAAGGEGSWAMAPRRVTCRHCGARFDATPADA
jgi:hypothetical protein